MSTTTPLEQAVRDQLERSFEDLGESSPHDMLAMVNRCVERTVLQVAMERTEGNQSRAAEWLGLNRNTLRKKLSDHRLLGVCFLLDSCQRFLDKRWSRILF